MGDATKSQSHPQSLVRMSLQGRVVAVVLATAAALLMLAAFLAWRTAQTPFPGLFTEPTLVINNVGDLTWAGYAAGLRNPAQLVALDGRLLDNTRALMRELARYEPGDVAEFTARLPDDSVRTLPVRLQALADVPGLLFPYFVLPYSLGVIYLGIGLWVFWVRWREPAGRVFAVTCAVVAVGLGLLFDLYTTHWLSRLWITAVSLVGSVLAHLALVLPQRPRYVERLRFPYWVVYVPGVVIAGVNQFTVLDFARPVAYFATWRAAFLFASMGAFAFLAMMAYRGFRSESPIVRVQARTILLGSVFAFGPMAIWFVGGVYAGRAMVFVFPWLVLFPLSIAYAIVRQRLFNINLVISRSVAYALLGVGVIGVYLLMLLLIRRLLGVTLPAGHPLVLGIVGVLVLLLALLMDPVLAPLQRRLDRVLLGRAVDHQQVVAHFVGRLAETAGLSSVLQALDEALEAGWQLQFAALFLFDAQRARYIPHAIGSNPFPAVAFVKDSPLVHLMLGQQRSLYLYRDHPIPASLTAEGEALEALRSSLFIPVPGHGWLTLGPKRSGASFSTDDLATLQSLASSLTVALEKARLFGDLERRMTEMDVLRWVGQAVNFTMNVDDLMELVYAQTSRVLDTTNFYIALYNQDKGTLSFAFYVRDGERLYPDDEWPVEVGLTGEIVRTGRPIVTTDYVRECQRLGVKPGGEPGQAWMGVPLSAGDRVIGVMNVSSLDPGVAYTEEQLNIFSAIADQAAAILDKARLYRAMEERTRQLTVLNEVGSVITSTLDLRLVLNLIMEKAVELLQVEAGSLLMRDAETDELVVEVTAGPSSANLVGKRLPAGSGIAGRVVREGKPMIVGDVQSDPHWYRGLSEGPVPRSILATPLISRGRIIGVIELLNRRDGALFDEDDERLLTAFAADAAISIENALLFTQTDRALADRVEELSMMQHIDRDLNATLDYRQVMAVTLNWALRMTGADAGLLATVVETDGARGLRLLASQGYPDDLLAAYAETLWPLDRGIVGRVARTGKPELVEDVSGDPDYVAVVPNMLAQLAVPISREERIIGVISLESSRRGFLNQEGLALVTRLANHAAIAIENARLFDEVRRANDAKTEFISFVSHELRQPMTSIKGYTDLLIRGAGGELTDTQRMFLDTVRANVDRMNTLVSELLDISRIESGRLRLEIGDVSVEEVVEEVLRTTRGEIEAKKQVLEVDVPPDLPRVRGDRSRLVQVMTNLVSNAYKYTPEGGRISIRVQRWPDAEAGGADRFVLCAVTDTGIGISPGDQKRLFTKYFRADHPLVRSVTGTGLGLVITRSLVELQGGRIWVESKPGQGSTFWFTIPVASG